jgi:hypothetical protein
MNQETPDDARTMLDLINDQQRRINRDEQRPVVWLYAIWALAWAVGYLGLYLASLGMLAAIAAGMVFAVLIAGSIAASAVLGSRIGRGVKGASRFAGMVYGISWSFCSVAFALLGIGLLGQGMPGGLAVIYFPSAYALMCGTIYLGGAAIWADRLQFAVGAALLSVGAAAPFLGSGANLLAMSIAGLVIFGSGALIAGRRMPR